MRKKKTCNFDCDNCQYDDCVTTSTKSPYGIEKQKYSQKEYYRKNRDRILSDAKDYYQKNKEKKRKQALDYYYAHREEISQKRKEKRKLCK